MGHFLNSILYGLGSKDDCGSSTMSALISEGFRPVNHSVPKRPRRADTNNKKNVDNNKKKNKKKNDDDDKYNHYYNENTNNNNDNNDNNRRLPSREPLGAEAMAARDAGQLRRAGPQEPKE